MASVVDGLKERKRRKSWKGRRIRQLKAGALLFSSFSLSSLSFSSGTEGNVGRSVALPGSCAWCVEEEGSGMGAWHANGPRWKGRRRNDAVFPLPTLLFSRTMQPHTMLSQKNREDDALLFFFIFLCFVLSSLALRGRRGI